MLLSRVCEEFGLSPSVAIREITEAPAAVLLDLLDLRAYRRAKERVEADEKAGEVEMSDTTALVEEIRGRARGVQWRRLQDGE